MSKGFGGAKSPEEFERAEVRGWKVEVWKKKKGDSPGL
jgi:hypothetical protein